MVAWLLEGAVLWRAAHWAGFELALAKAILVTALTMAAQVVAVAPGGIGTYEAAAAASLAALGATPGQALAAALSAHALKFAHAFAAGAVALLTPGLQRRAASRPAPIRDEPATAPAVLSRAASRE